jgi:glycogen(starch) synthase
MRILMLSDLPTDSTMGSGAERFITILIEGLTELGHNIDFVSFYSNPPDETSLSNYDIIHVHNYSMATEEMQRALMSTKTPVIFTVHDYLYLCTRRHGLSAKGYPCPFVGQDRSICEACMPFGHKVVDGLLESVQIVVADSERMAEIFREHLPNSDVRAILLGVPPRKHPRQRAKKKQSFLYMGRHSLEKGYVEMLAAFKSFNTMRPDTRLIITHSGNGSQALKILVDRTGLSHKIEITGRIKREKLDALIDNCVAVLAPSIWEEPFNLTITEAWQHSKPVIASRIGAHEELLEYSRGGLLYDPYDIEALALRMKILYDNPSLARLIGINGHNSIGRYFNQKRMIRDYDFLYKEVAQK